jgi:hypothetical protein
LKENLIGIPLSISTQSLALIVCQVACLAALHHHVATALALANWRCT